MVTPRVVIKAKFGTFLVVQWLRVRLPVQGMWVMISGRGIKIAHAMKQLSPWATTREAQEPQEGSHIPQLRPDAAKKKKKNKFKGSQEWVPEVPDTKPKFIGQGMILNKE